MAFNCKIKKPLGSEVCDTSVSGITRLAFINYSEFVGTDTDCAALEIYTDNGSQAAAPFMDIIVSDNTAYANATLTATGGGKAINHQVGGIVANFGCDEISDWKNYLLGSVVIATQTKNGEVFLYGADNGLTATNFDQSTGTAATDTSGITFLFEGLQRNPAISIGTADMTPNEKWAIVTNAKLKP